MKLRNIKGNGELESTPTAIEFGLISLQDDYVSAFVNCHPLCIRKVVQFSVQDNKFKKGERVAGPFNLVLAICNKDLISVKEVRNEIEKKNG